MTAPSDTPSDAPPHVSAATCMSRGLSRLRTYFPDVPVEWWQPRPFGMWRTDHGDLFVRAQYLYVRLWPPPQTYLCTIVTYEFLDQYLDNAEREISATLGAR